MFCTEKIMLKCLKKNKLEDKQLICQKFESFQILGALLNYEQKNLMTYFREHILKPHVNIETGHGKILFSSKGNQLLSFATISQNWKVLSSARESQRPPKPASREPVSPPCKKEPFCHGPMHIAPDGQPCDKVAKALEITGPCATASQAGMTHSRLPTNLTVV